MAKHSENNITSSGDFLRYSNGEMSGEERNAFERKLQKDPFAEEASEGISLIPSGEEEKDLRELKKKLETRIRKKSFAIYYRTAAAVAILAAISVIFLNRNRDTGDIVSKNEFSMPDTSFSIAASEPLKDISEKSVAKNEGPKQSTQVSPHLPISPSPTLPVSPSPNASDNQLSAVSSDLKEDISEDKAEVNAVYAEEQALPLPSESEKKMEMSRVAGVSVKLTAKGKDVAEYIPSQPVNGIDSFNIYLEKNIRNPQPEEVQEKIVILDFRINTDSTISDYRIIESPGPAYSREAKRLIKEGPRWIPATQKGIPVKEEYRLKIVFR
jgi:hypothetical protein